MTYPHRPGAKAGSTAMTTMSAQGWTVRKAQAAVPPASVPMRRYEVMALMPDGSIADEVRAAPAVPMFENAFAAIAHGTLVATREGPVAVEDLIPGMEVETRDHGPQALLWRGATTLVPRAGDAEACRLYRIPMDSFGAQRPMPDLLLGPHARLVHRSAALKDLIGTDTALVPLEAFVDGHHLIEVHPVSPVHVFHLGFSRHEVITVNGLQIESFHPGTEVATRLPEVDLKRYLSLFPHLTGLAGFGPLKPRLEHVERHPRLVLGAADHQRGLDAGDVVGGGQFLGQEALEGRQIGRHAFQDEIDLAVQHVALAHERPGGSAPRRRTDRPRPG
jgi:hypothetical protein